MTSPIERTSASGRRGYENGDPVWIRLHGQPGVHEGRIIAEFTAVSATGKFFIIHMLQPDWTLFEVRDPYQMAKDPREAEWLMPLPSMNVGVRAI